MAGDLSGADGAGGIGAAAEVGGGSRSVGAETPVQANVLRPVMRREMIAVALWTLLADLLIFRAYGFAGPGVFFAAVPLLLLVGCEAIRRRNGWRWTAALLGVVATRLLWQGSGLAVFSAAVLVVALGMLAAGAAPFVLEGALMASRLLIDGARRLGMYRMFGRSSDHPAQRDRQRISWTLPILSAMIFGSIFVFANPDLLDWVSDRMTQLADRIQGWLIGISYFEPPFCVLALLIGAGLMRPGLPLRHVGPRDDDASQTHQETERSTLYVAFRNTLVTLISLFAVYLVFEFVTLWKRDFPPGFYYAGYAHQGAAWLTLALALATATLSIVFNRSMLRDDRVDSLRRLAWIWSAQNLLLAAAVYNRLMIYVGYNGMTRLRTVAFFGVTVVVAGFILVLVKIARDRGFWWLIRMQLVALLLTVIAYSVFPVDWLAHRYNARVILRGYLHPSVMIAVKPKSDEGMVHLLSLTSCEDEIIREGVLALLAQREAEISNQRLTHWTQFQGSRWWLARQLRKQRTRWTKYQDRAARDDAIAAFTAYAMQWY